MATTSPVARYASQLGNKFMLLTWKQKIAASIVAAIVLIAGPILTITALLNAYNFSHGFRTGAITKLSTKGFGCWTMEGQLAQANFSQSGNLRSRNDSVDNTFYFSVPDSEVRKKIEDAASGGAVTLEYNQKLFVLSWPIPGFCKRRTEYEIIGVKTAPDAVPNAPLAPVRP